MKMKWSLYLGKIAGIRIFVHWTFLILVLWIIQMHINAGDSVDEIIVGLAFLVKDEDEIKGTLSWKEIVSGIATHRTDAPVEQVMNKEVVRIRADTPLTDADLQRYRHGIVFQGFFEKP